MDLITPKPGATEDDESFAFVSVKTLSRYHFLSGDKVMIEGPEKSRRRICRIYGLEERVDTPSIIRKVVLSRVPTPISTCRAYENAFIEALRKHFQTRDRIICEGDIIGICFGHDNAQLENDGSSICLRTEKKNTNVAVVCFKVKTVEFSRTSPPVLFHGGIADIDATMVIEEGQCGTRTPCLLRYFNATYDIPPPPRFIPEDSPLSKLRNITSSSVHPLAVELGLSCSILLHGPRGNGKRVLTAWAAEMLGVCFYDINCYGLIGEEGAVESALRNQFAIAATFAPCIFVLRNIEALAPKHTTADTGQESVISSAIKRCLTDNAKAIKKTGRPVLLIATTSDSEKVSDSVLNCFRHEVKMEVPDEASRLSILQTLTAKVPLAPDVSLPSLAVQTASLVVRDLVDLVSQAGVAGLERVSKATTVKGDEATHQVVTKAGIAVNALDFDRALSKARTSYSDSIGASRIPKVTWDDVGGLASVKDDILDTIQLPLKYPELFASGMKKRSGILFYGPPGTGKTLLAKAVATSCSLNFYSVKGPELLTMYIGESEANVRKVFQRARDAKPCVIFFDELDSIAPKRGEKGDSGGVMDRIVSQILAELDGMNSDNDTADVFVIGATNRPDLLDPALLRPGRFHLAPDLDLRQFAEKCPLHYSGADFYALCSDAMLKAMARTVNELEKKVQNWNRKPELSVKYPVPMTMQYYLDRLARPEETEVLVHMIDFEKALSELVPSITQHELDRYKEIRSQFEKPQHKAKPELPRRPQPSSSYSEKTSLFQRSRSSPELSNSDTKTKKKEKGKGYKAKMWPTILFN
ncbi:AAA-domain-containing protein [Basidiobolus meristosporus CBS 931.73]|uniref:Peroxisomal ATPase PEX6 n=1 Tax=Basidiobolus meristosporus CBS 931.73 TaxID=1314790 RepID=A0A1Y1Y4S0_9FUNG|nr:AAA-domain-containing protein [Basidiobolus meristosporus CBS 931.73]|eukprot:ORX92604.1 AAA-domain-containing protein [Basidiobolus meristosporus CBS 931.73]